MFQLKQIVGMIVVHALMPLAPEAIAATGNLDPDFADVGRLGPNAGLDGSAWSLELLQDGSLLIAGGDIDCVGRYPYPPRCHATNFVDRVDAAGTLDESWTAGVLENVLVLDATVQPDGKLLAVGHYVDGYPGRTRLVAFRLQSDGSLDPGFGSAGIVELSTENDPGNHQGRTVALEPDGRIVIAGALEGELFVLRLLADGGPDDSFGNAGLYHDSAAAHGAAQRIVRTAAGSYRIMTAGARCRVVALTEAGAIDEAYGASGVVNLESSPGVPIACGSLASQADGRLLVAGSAGTAGVAIRLLESGLYDPSFAADARVASVLTGATAIAAGANGTILLGGSGIQGAAIMRLQADGALDALFGNGGITELDLPSESGSQPVIRDLVVGADGEVLAAGGDLNSDSTFVIRLLGDAGGESAGVLGVSQPLVDVSEDDLEAIVTVRRTGGSDGTVSAAYETAAGSATADEDYQAVTGVLTWADGDTGEKQIVVPIAIVDSPEEHEDFRVTLHDAQGGAGLGTRGGTVTILPDGSPAGQFAIFDGYDANEADIIEVWVYRNYYCAGEVSVTVTPASGTAIAGEDFDSPPTMLTWGDQDCEAKRILIQIRDDSTDEESETFTMVLSNATGGAIIGPYSVAAYSITRNDFEVTGGSGGNGGGGSASWATVLALLALLLARRQRDGRAVARRDAVTASGLLGTILATLLAACGGNGSSTASNQQTIVNIEPGAASTPPATMLPITASVQGDTTQQGVTWTISPATGAGTLSDETSTSVTYNAPDNPPASDLTVTITATSVADSAVSDTVTLTIPANVAFIAKSVPCPAEAEALNASCGTVDVPLDRRNVTRGTIPIYFERYAHTGPVLESAIVVASGGPGNATRRAPALRLFGPNLDTHDLLLIHARGTGNSNAINCPSLQQGWASWDVTAAECAAQLGPAASFYGSVDIAKDTEAVRMALGYDKIDYYGLSWGGATVTAYATRFASHLRSIILDAPVAGPLLDQSNFLWERHTTQSAPLTIAQQCLYSPACFADHPDPVAEIVALIQSIRATPVEGEFIGAGGAPIQLRIDEYDLLVCMLGSGSAFFRGAGELPAAAQALARGDPLPLLRLRAEGWCPGPYDHGDPAQSSAGAGWATGCTTLNQPFDWSNPVPDRLSEYDAAVAALPTGYFDPFATSAATSFQYGWGACVYFEKPTPTQRVVRPEANFPSTPTLVIGGDIDYWFPSAAVEAVAAQYPGSTLINVADTGHTAANWSQCARNLISEFVANLRLDNPACAQVPETVWPAVGRFPLLASGARPADVDPGGGNEIDIEERKVVTVAIAAMTDALQRGLVGGPGHGVGLRGGTFSRAWGPQLTLTLVECAFTTDVIVSGLVTWAHSDIFGDGSFLPGFRPLTADLVVSGPGTAGGTLHVAGSWLSNDPDGYFRVTGTLGGKEVAVLVPEA